MTSSDQRWSATAPDQPSVTGDLIYRYRMPPWALWLMVAVTLFGGALIGWALGTEGQLTTTGGEPLNPVWAVFFALTGIGWLVYLALLVMVDLQGGRTVTLTAEALVIPRQYWSQQYLVIPYREIVSMNLVVLSRWPRLMVTHHSRQTNGLAEKYFPSSSAFNEFMTVLTERIPAR